MHLGPWPFDSHVVVAFYFSMFLKIKENVKKKKSRVPVATSVNDTHNGVLTQAIIKLDSTQLSAKTNLSAQLTWECCSWNGTEEGGQTVVFHGLEIIKCQGCGHC